MPSALLIDETNRKVLVFPHYTIHVVQMLESVLNGHKCPSFDKHDTMRWRELNVTLFELAEKGNWNSCKKYFFGDKIIFSNACFFSLFRKGKWAVPWVWAHRLVGRPLSARDVLGGSVRMWDSHISYDSSSTFKSSDILWCLIWRSTCLIVSRIFDIRPKTNKTAMHFQLCSN